MANTLAAVDKDCFVSINWASVKKVSSKADMDNTNNNSRSGAGDSSSLPGRRTTLLAKVFHATLVGHNWLHLLINFLITLHTPSNVNLRKLSSDGGMVVWWDFQNCTKYARYVCMKQNRTFNFTLALT
jgi:hypothetical protein